MKYINLLVVRIKEKYNAIQKLTYPAASTASITSSNMTNH